MKNKLLTGLRQENNWTRTENNALTNKSTLDDVLDYFYHAPAMRGQDTTTLFANAFNDNFLLATKALFYVRDIRGGQGERETFRQGLRWLRKNDYKTFIRVIELVPEYGTWEDVIEFVDSGTVWLMVQNQLKNDIDTTNPSLLAKWMPSENTSSKDTIKLAKKWIARLDSDFLFNAAYKLTGKKVFKKEEAYRKVLVTLRKKLQLVETAMSARKFGEIDYQRTPSVAMNRLRNAFSRHDPEGFVAYLESVKKGEKKINASVLYPYELVKGYASVHMEGYDYSTTRLRNVDDVIEEQWKALPNYADSNVNALAVVDISESMYRSVNNNKVMPIYVSVSLGIYLAERNHGAFRNNFMVFSKSPELVTLRNGTLKNKVDQVFRCSKGYDTNIQKVFDQLLTVAIRNKVSEEDMPKRIFIFSDMEFNDPNVGSRNTNYDLIKRKYAVAGYTMPTLIFWNIDSKQIQTPVTVDENGVYLVAGCSPSIMKQALTTTVTTPLDMMMEKLNSERYAAVEEVLLA